MRSDYFASLVLAALAGVVIRGASASAAQNAAGGSIVKATYASGPHHNNEFLQQRTQDCSRVVEDGDHVMLFTSFYDVNGTHLYSSPEDSYVHVIADDERYVQAFSSGLKVACLHSSPFLSISPSQGYVHTSLLPPAPFLTSTQDATLIARVWVDAITPAEDWTLFGALAERNSSKVLDMIDEHKGVNAVDELGYSPLMRAVLQDAQTVAFALLNARRPRVDVNWSRPTGHTAIFYTLQRPSPAMLTVLLRRGADPNARLRTPGSKGATALHFAAALGRVEHVEQLLEFNADPTIEAEGGRRPIDFINPSTLVPSALKKLRKLLTDATTKWGNGGGKSKGIVQDL